jgi:hypothetical protein
MQALVDSGELEAALEIFFREVVGMPGQQHVAMDTSPELFATEVIDFLLNEAS